MVAIAVVGTVGLPARYGGWETLVDNLTLRAPAKYQFTVYCTSKKYKKRLDTYNSAKLIYIPLDANGFQSILYDAASLLHAAFKADQILILGVSGCVFLPLIRLITKAKLIVNIDGIEWKRPKWGWFASRFLKLSEMMAVKFSDVVITDNPVIHSYVKSTYSVTSVTIPYGGDHAVSLPYSSIEREGIPKNWTFVDKNYAFSVCRIEPENNIHLILQAFEDINDLLIVIVGNWNNSEYGRRLREKYAKRDN